MSRLTNWIRKHQVTAFFILTFTITWGLGFSYSAVEQSGKYLLLPLAFVASCGPALAGIIITAAINTQPKQEARRAFWAAFLIAWASCTLVCLANLRFIEHNPISPVVVILFTISAAPVPFVIASAYSCNPSVRSYLASLVRLKGVWGWALLASVGMAATVLLAVPVSNFLYRRPISTFDFPDVSVALIGLVLVKFLYQWFFFNATGEEVGWRGFALLRLQARTSPLVAALLIGVFWTLWHFFYWKAEGQPVMTVDFCSMMFAGHILLSVLIVWIFNRAQGSILVAGVAHAAANTAQAFIANQIWALCAIWAIVALVVVLVDRMWKRLPADHPAVHRKLTCP